jgi:hypothetical protein
VKKRFALLIISIMVSFAPLPHLEPPLDKLNPPEVSAQTKLPVELVEPTPTPIPERIVQPIDNESMAWVFLTSNGFSKEQTAGIMGNLMQEHHFQTSDTPGGLGIAQWMGGRRDNLMARSGWDTIGVQLQFLLDELNSGYINTKNAILLSQSIDESTIIFQNGYEKCGVCMEGQRIQYGYEIFNKYS